MSTPIIRVHWLDESRAFRVLQLLEQLDLDYEIVPYKRKENFRAPEEIKKVHPLGRFPVVELEDRTTGEKKILAESGYIFHYILEHFDTKGQLKNDNPKYAEQIEYFLYYAEGSLQLPLMVEFILSMTKKAPLPFPISYFAGKVADKISDKYSKGELKNQFQFVEGEIAKNQGYLVGGKLSGADILLLFPLQMALLRGFVTREEFPHIAKFVDTLNALDSYSAAKKKANANGGKF